MKPRQSPCGKFESTCRICVEKHQAACAACRRAKNVGVQRAEPEDAR